MRSSLVMRLFLLRHRRRAASDGVVWRGGFHLGKSHEIAETILLYGITEISPPAKSMAGLIVAAVVQLEAAVAKLESKSGITEHGIEVHRIENVGDTESRRAIGDLFSGPYDAITIIKLKDFYTLLEDSLDRCEDVANVIEGITIKNA